MSDAFSGSTALASSDPLSDPEAQSRLQHWLQTQLGTPLGSPATFALSRFQGGQSNPSYRIDLGDKRFTKSFVLRSKPAPAAKLLPSAHAIEREYRVLRALQHSQVPTARAIALCADESVLGRAFYLMDFVPGKVFWDPRLPELNSEQRAQVFAEMNRVLVAIHGLDPGAVGLADFAAPGNYYDRQIGRWTKQYRASEQDRIEAMESLIAWLPANQPKPEQIETRLLHGDYRLDNFIFDPASLQISAVLDWELATLGDPMAELAYNALAWYSPPGAMRGMAGFDLTGHGIPSLLDYRAQYERASGRTVGAHWNFYLAYNLFRLAAIMQGVAARARQGIASSAAASAQGALARPAAELGWTLANETATY